MPKGAPYAFPLQFVHDVLAELLRVVVEGEVENDAITRRGFFFFALLGPCGSDQNENENGDNSVAPAHLARLRPFPAIVKH